MSFYTVIDTEMGDLKIIISALEELKSRGEIRTFEYNEQKETITVDRDGDILNIIMEKSGNFQVGGDARVAERFAQRLKQMYAYQTIIENLPLDFEIAQEIESSGEIRILLKS